MTGLVQRFPVAEPVRPEALAARLGEGEPLRVGDERVVAFLAAFARRLLAPGVARRHPELASLGFFLRKRELASALERLGEGLRFPRGLVFHVPPANVDTVFVYSWALSALAGNRNVVRVSPRGGAATTEVLAALNAALSDVDAETARVIGATQRMVTYDRDDAAGAALSAACDLRVLWGGDATIDALRLHPLAPHARDLTFPDRSSFAVASVRGWRQATAAERERAARGCYSDAYWFGQAACSSPRALFWVGGEAEAAEAADEFRALLAAVLAAEGHVGEPEMAVRKRAGVYAAAADGTATRIGFAGAGDGLATLELAEPGAWPRDWLGAGTFACAAVPSLADLVPVVARRDQTVTYFGFGRDELADFATRLGGRGVDRMVPFGSALAFSAVWDGYDLLAEFTRLVTIR